MSSESPLKKKPQRSFTEWLSWRDILYFLIYHSLATGWFWMTRSPEIIISNIFPALSGLCVKFAKPWPLCLKIQLSFCTPMIWYGQKQVENWHLASGAKSWALTKKGLISWECRILLWAILLLLKNCLQFVKTFYQVPSVQAALILPNIDLNYHNWFKKCLMWPWCVWIYIKTYWPAGGGRGQNPENTAQGNSVQNPICP